MSTLTETLDVTVYDFDRARKILAIKFLRAVCVARDGTPLDLRRAKNLVDDLEAGDASHIVIEHIPAQLHQLVSAAATDCRVVLTPSRGCPRYI